MRLMDIKYLKRSSGILKKYPHLAGATVSSIFDKIHQKEDGSFVITGDHPKLGSINIEDGRHSVWSNPHRSYCGSGQAPEADNCIPWFGDKDTGNLLFGIGPDKDAGNVTHLNWEEHTRKPDTWVWVLSLIILWILIYGKG
jgi:hypothetical protein